MAARALSNYPELTVEAVKAACPILDIVQSYGVQLRRAGREYVGLSPFKAERTPSFYVHPQKGVFHCFSSGYGGDVIKFVMLAENVDFREALSRLAQRARLGGSVVHKPAPREADAGEAERRRERLARARAIWNASLPAEGTLVETYLRARAIDLDAIRAVYGYNVPGALRFHPALPYQYAGTTHCGPAMVGAIVDRCGRFTGVHRTWLSLDGQAKAKLLKPKLTLGVVWGSFTPLSPRGERAIFGEGYETTLTVMAALAARGERAFFLSALSLGNICGAGAGSVFDPARPALLLPSSVREAVILGDSDGKDPDRTRAMIARACAKFRVLQGIETRVAWAEKGMDFNDMARRAGCYHAKRG